MSPEPLHEGDYTDRQVEAARRVLVDVGQVLGSFRDAIVVVGGWVPDLLFPDADPRHVGSIDVDLALDAVKLGDGRYAELLKLLLDTGRYDQGDKDFQLVTTVDLGDGEVPVRVEVEFLASSDVKLKKNHPKLVEGFRVLRFPACAAAFEHPESIEFEGQMISGATNTVRLQVASLPDFIIMKAHALAGRDKPKDVYDLCYCLDEYPDAIGAVAGEWRSRREAPLVAASIEILREKFKAVDHYGPQQLAIFHDSTDDAERAMHARRAFELIQKLLSLL
ncbi:MAG: nucleotidyl transferase AbiEii/AbiGii toxin family protein [Verrucomicrobiales bacterium]